MKKHKKGRRFVRRVHVQKVQGIAVEVPERLQTDIHTRQPDSVAMLTCPLCGAKRYVNQAFLDFGKELRQVAIEGVPAEYKQDAEQLIPASRHIPCNAIFHVTMLEAEKKATTDRLAEALSLAGSPQWMIDLALAGYYDDYKSEQPAPIIALAEDARKYGLTDIARRAMDGEFDATKEEGDAWAKSPEGQAIFRQLAGGKE